MPKDPNIRKLISATLALTEREFGHDMDRTQLRSAERDIAECAQQLLEKCRTMNARICQMPVQAPRVSDFERGDAA